MVHILEEVDSSLREEADQSRDSGVRFLDRFSVHALETVLGNYAGE